MQIQHSDGFTRARLLLVIGGVVLLLFGVLGTYWSTTTSRQKEATSFSNTFITNINKQQIDAGYKQLSTKLQKQIGSTYGFQIWAADFKRSNVQIQETPSSIDNGGFSFTQSPPVLTYNINDKPKLRITITKEDNNWRVDNYAIID